MGAGFSGTLHFAREGDESWTTTHGCVSFVAGELAWRALWIAPGTTWQLGGSVVIDLAIPEQGEFRVRFVGASHDDTLGGVAVFEAAK